MAQPKSQRTARSVQAFLDATPDEPRRRDARTLEAIMRDITRTKPEMWGSSIVASLDDVHLSTLKALIRKSVSHVRRRNG